MLEKMSRIISIGIIILFLFITFCLICTFIFQPLYSLPGAKGKLPIVAMTANAFAEDVQLAKNTGMNGHIAKPLDMNKLNDVLKNWL